MKLATRLVPATAVTVLLASACAGAALVRLEERQLSEVAESEARLLARALQVSVENALRDGQDPDIAELLGRLELVAGAVDVFVFSRDATEPRQTSQGADGRDPHVLALTARSRAEGEVVARLPGATGERLALGVPLQTDPGARIGTLIVTRPLTVVRADLRSTSALIALSVLAFAVATTAVLAALIRREVTAPLARIDDATRGLAHDLDRPLALPPGPSDELRGLAGSIVDLQRALVDARSAAARDARQREDLERRLHHADKLSVVGQLAAGVAHEIGSPLQVLVGRAGLLAGDPTLPDDVRRQGALIGDHASRIASIVDRLQDVVRRRPSRIEQVPLAEPVTRVIWLLEPEARARQVALIWAPPDPCPSVVADADEVQQVVLNLTLNALHATSPGGRVTVEVSPDGSTVRVSDDGVGMDDTTRERAFEPFFTTRGAQGGTGLGLAVVRAIADRHRARLQLDSAPGRGTTVTVTWPGVPHVRP